MSLTAVSAETERTFELGHLGSSLKSLACKLLGTEPVCYLNLWIFVSLREGKVNVAHHTVFLTNTKMCACGGDGE